MIKGILKGHLNELLKKESELYDRRMAICRVCPLFKQTHIGPICNPDLYLNAATEEVSNTAKEGFKKGCRCRLEAKTRVVDAKCPNDKW